MALQTIKNEAGVIQISDHALAALAGITARQFPEIVALEPGLVDDLTSMFGKDPNTVGVRITGKADELTVELYIRVRHGVRIPDVALRLQEKVRTALETYADVTVVAIHIFVQGIAFDEAGEDEE